MNKWLSLILLVASLVLPGMAFAQTQQPMTNVGGRHPNLDAAQHLCLEAYQKLLASQKANEFDQGGHAAQAKELLDQVNAQIAQAAKFDNHK